ncbi:MAG TPA: class I SAM-dependent methyltransferase [Thermoanaerobaculia bacterium]
MNPREYEIMFAREDAYWWYRGMRRVTRAFAPGLFIAAAGSRLLDAGCGTGRNLQDLEAAGGHAVGIDVSLRALGLARRRGKTPLVCGSIEALPFRTGAFAGALSRDVLYMVPREEAAARELARVLAVGGTLVVSSPAFRALSGAHDRAVGGLRRHTAGDLERLVKDVGLAVVRTTYANFFLVGPILILRKVTQAMASRHLREEVSSDFDLSPGPFEEIFLFLLSLEGRIVRRGRLPFGTTVLVLAEKPVQGTSVAAK